MERAGPRFIFIYLNDFLFLPGPRLVDHFNKIQMAGHDQTRVKLPLSDAFMALVLKERDEGGCLCMVIQLPIFLILLYLTMIDTDRARGSIESHPSISRTIR